MDPPTYPFEETSFMDGPLGIKEKIFQSIRHLVSKRKIKWEISSIFSGLLENLNFM